MHHGSPARMPSYKKNQQGENTLQATTIADITNAEGSKISNYEFGGRHSRTSENPRKSTHEWPRQPRPKPKSWKAWREAIQFTLSSNGKNQTLRQPLGEWTIEQAQTRKNGTGILTPQQESYSQETAPDSTFMQQLTN
jgi:hypothetical protein